MGKILKIFKKGKNEPYLALDVGTELIKALIFRPTNKEGDLEILGIGRASRPQESFRLSIEGLISGAGEAIRKALKIAKVIPVKAILGLGGEFIKAKTNCYSFKRSQPKEKIDSTELKNLIQKTEWKIFEEIKSSIRKNYFSKESEIKLVDTELSEILIDGYKVENPLDFSGKVITLKIFNSFCNKSYFKILERIPRVLNLNHMVLTSTSYAIAKMLLAEKQDFEAILIDIGSDNTEVSLVKDRALVGNFTFNIGGRGFTECISRALGIGFAEAEQIKLSFSLKKVSSSVRENIRKILKREFKIWTTGIGLGLEQFSSLELLPNQILLYGGGSLLAGIQKTLGAVEWQEFLTFAKTPVVKIIYPKDIKGVRDLTGQVSTPQDIPVLALTTYFRQEQKESNHLLKILYQAVKVAER